MVNEKHYAVFATELTKRAMDEKLVMMRGYLVPSEDKKTVRLYFDPELKSFMDIAKEDIRHTEADKDSKLGAAFVWTTPDVRYVAPVARNASDDDENNPFEGKRVEKQYNHVSRLAAGRAIVSTMGCNATTPNAFVGGGLFSVVTPVIPDLFIGQRGRFGTASCNATTPNGEIIGRGKNRLGTASCNATTPNGEIIRRRNMLGTASCNATTPNGEMMRRRKNMLGTHRCNATSHLWF